MRLFMIAPAWADNADMRHRGCQTAAAVGVSHIQALDVFSQEAAADDWLGLDWLTGEYTGKRERLKRELEQLDAGVW